MSTLDTDPDDKDQLLQLAESQNEPGFTPNRAWKLLVVDDEKEVHTVTHLALDDFAFGSHPLEIISAYSGEEAKKIMAEQPDIAMILLDVVMETEHAGLDVVKYIREELGNRFVRIILRTGQPGQAPEYQVITEYDINDYKHKTELTREKMFSLVYTSLSGYRDLVALEANRRGLEKVIEASACIFEMRSIEQFTQGVLEQLTALLYMDQEAVVVKTAALSAQPSNSHLKIIAATGRYQGLVGKDAVQALEPERIALINRAREEKQSITGDNYYVDYYSTESGSEQIVFACGNSPVSIPDLHMIDLFSRNVAIAYQNVEIMNEGNKD